MVARDRAGIIGGGGGGTCWVNELVLARSNHGYDRWCTLDVDAAAVGTAMGIEGPEGGCSVAVDGAQIGVTVC